MSARTTYRSCRSQARALESSAPCSSEKTSRSAFRRPASIACASTRILQTTCLGAWRAPHPRPPRVHRPHHTLYHHRRRFPFRRPHHTLYHHRRRYPFRRPHHTLYHHPRRPHHTHIHHPRRSHIHRPRRSRFRRPLPRRSHIYRPRFPHLRSGECESMPAICNSAHKTTPLFPL